jgi:hypothetical protein
MSINFLLFKNMDKESKHRIILMIITVMIGVCVAISYSAAVNALFQRLYRSNRSIYYAASYKNVETKDDGLLVKVDGDSNNLSMWQDKQANIVEIAASNPSMKSFYGLTIPKEGTYYVSRKLESLINKNSGLKQRLLQQGKMVGYIPDSFLTSPDDLVAFKGMSSDVKKDSTSKITSLVSMSEFTKSVSVSKQILVIIGTITLLFPVMMLVSIASQLGSMQKERRYAALRLVGATKGQINKSIITESLFTAIIGTALGTILFYLVRPLYCNVTLGGLKFFLDDLSISPLTYLIIVAITILLCLFTDMLNMRKMKSSPLGVMKKEKIHKNPRIWRLIPLAIGIGLLAYMSTKTRSWYDSSSGNSFLFMYVVMAALLLIMIGLVIAGSYITMIVSKIIARFTRRPVLLLSMKRVSALASRTFRAVGGVVIALYVGCFYLSAIGGITDYIATQSNTQGWQKLKDQAVIVIDDSNADNAYNALKKTPGVQNLILTRYTEKNELIVNCSNLKTFFNDVTCKSGSASAVAQLSLEDNSGLSTTTETVMSNKVNAILMTIDKNANIDTIRDAVAKSDGGIVNDYSYVQSGSNVRASAVQPVIYELAELAYIAIILTIAISMISLFVSTMGGMLERKSSFYNLNLGGLPVKQLREIMLIESMLPLILVSIVSSLLGFLTAKYIMRVMSSLPSVGVPTLYYCIVAGLIIVAGVGVYALSSKVKGLVKVENNQTE